MDPPGRAHEWEDFGMKARMLMLALVMLAALAFGATAFGAAAFARSGLVASFATARSRPASESFNGRSSVVTIRRSKGLELSRAMTLEARVRPSSRLSGRRDIVVKTRRGGKFPWGVELRDGVPDVYATIGGHSLVVRGSSALALRKWFSVEASYDGRRLRLYVDGRLLASRSARGRLGRSRGPVQVGGDSVSGRHFRGLIDDVRVYDRALPIPPLTGQAQPPTTTSTSAPANTNLPSIGGTAVEGDTLTANPGSWSNGTTGYTYQWEDCSASGASCSNISGATATTYVLEAGDAGDTIRVVVWATNASARASATSTATGVVRSSGSTAIYYMGQSAAGSANGSSCANQEPASWFDASSHWGSGTGKIGPGDVVDVCGTVTSPLTAYGSGTSGSPIAIVWQPGAALSEPYCPGSGCFNTNGHSYLMLNGRSDGVIQSTSNGTLLADHNGNAVGILALDCAGCTIENLTIADMYVHYYNAKTHPTDTKGGGTGINISGSDATIAGNTIHDTDNGIFAQWNATDSDDRIDANQIYNINGGILLAPNQTGGSIGPLYINNNTIENFGNWDDSSFDYHHDGIHCYTGAGAIEAHYNDVYIYDNAFGGVTDVNLSDADSMLILQSDNAGSECANSTSPFYIFDNVFQTTYAAGSALGYIDNGLLDTSSGHPYVFNNTLVGGQAPGGSTIYQAGGSANPGGATSVEFENNALSTADQLMNICDAKSTVEDGCTGAAAKVFSSGYPDYNLYAAGGPDAFECGSTDDAFTAFGAWRSCIGADSHSATASSLDLNGNGSPRSGSPVIGAGKNLTSLCTGALVPLCSDIDGTPRPATGAWDAGAYQ